MCVHAFEIDTSIIKIQDHSMCFGATQRKMNFMQVIMLKTKILIMENVLMIIQK